MPQVHVIDSTILSPDTVLTAARDFSENRVNLWPDVHLEHFKVHKIGKNFAEVTEGNPWPLMGTVWERLHYDWSKPGVVKGTVIKSNLFKPGSSWEIRAKSTGGRTKVEIIGIRHLKGRGLLLAPFFPTGLAKQSVADHLRHFISTVEKQASN